MKPVWLIVGMALTLSGCTWVEVDEGGKNVSLVASEHVGACDRLGTTRATTREKVAGLKRDDEKLEEELLALAKNSAADMGGDTIVPQGSISNGSQTFVVYDCSK